MLVSGFCPVQQDKYAIDVSYMDASTTDKEQFVKERFQCEYDLFGDKCTEKECPIYENAPKHIR